MESADIRFQVLPEPFEKRVKMIIEDFIIGKISDIKVASFFFKYFFKRLNFMFDINPKMGKNIKKLIENLIFGVIVPKFVNVTVKVKTISDLSFSKGINPENPIIKFKSLNVVMDIVLARYSLVQSYIDKKVGLRKIPELLKWIAPISLLQTPKMMEKIRNKELVLVDELLGEIGY